MIQRILRAASRSLGPAFAKRAKHDKGGPDVVFTTHQLPDDIAQKRQQIQKMWLVLIELGESQVPPSLDERAWSRLDKCQNNEQVMRTFKFLHEKEHARIQRSLERIALRSQMSDDSFEVITKDTKRMAYFYRHRVMSAIRLREAPHVVLDFSFDSIQRDGDYRELSWQVGHIINVNRECETPFQIHACNFNSADRRNTEMAKRLAFDDNLIFETPKSYLDLYPRDRLVYLTRDARRTMQKFDPNKVYIIGALTDVKRDAGRLASYAKAKQDRIHAEALPIDQYVEWQRGSKTLYINTVFEILTSLYRGQSWTEAFKNCLPKQRITRHLNESRTAS